MIWKKEFGGGGHHVTFGGKSKTVCWAKVRPFTQFVVVLSTALVF